MAHQLMFWPKHWMTFVTHCRVYEISVSLAIHVTLSFMQRIYWDQVCDKSDWAHDVIYILSIELIEFFLSPSLDRIDCVGEAQRTDVLQTGYGNPECHRIIVLFKQFGIAFCIGRHHHKHRNQIISSARKTISEYGKCRLMNVRYPDVVGERNVVVIREINFGFYFYFFILFSDAPKGIQSVQT